MILPILAPMTPEDVDLIMPLERQVFTDAWTRRMYLSDLTGNPLASYLVVRRPAIALSGRELPPVLGWGGLWLMVDEAHIATVASHPDWRGCGLGQLLVLALIAAAAERGAVSCTLEVRASNAAARALYSKLGFEEAGLRKKYYRDGEDGLIMTTPPFSDSAFQARLANAAQESLQRMTACFGGPGAPERAGQEPILSVRTPTSENEND